ncbi:MAG: Wzz/FepE/Etk N-terminal domain-containing protein [Actinomycetota bacterium]|nr:Wzz/FepE/Etk N-terminal domain-containing protein [Actinomycetota bacterium]
MNYKENNYSEEDTIDLRTLFRMFLKHKWWFIITVIVVAVLGFFYVSRTPALYEARYKFSLKEDYVQDDYLQYRDSHEKFINNQSVFIQAEEVPLILKTDLIFRALEDIPEVDDYEDYIDSSLIKIDLDKDTSVFSLKVKDTDEKLAKEIGLKLIESLGEQIRNQDIEIFDNTLAMISEDIKKIEEENSYFEEKISEIEKEINSMYSEMESSEATGAKQIEYEIMKKNGEVLLYEGKIIDNENEIRKLNDLYQEFTDRKAAVDNRIELLTEEPRITVENSRVINSIVVILLSILTGIIVVLGVNYIYKLKSQKD